MSNLNVIYISAFISQYYKFVFEYWQALSF